MTSLIQIQKLKVGEQVMKKIYDDDDEDHALECCKKLTAVKQKQMNLSDLDNVYAFSKQPLNQVKDLLYTIEAPTSLKELFDF